MKNKMDSYISKLKINADTMSPAGVRENLELFNKMYEGTVTLKNTSGEWHDTCIRAQAMAVQMVKGIESDHINNVELLIVTAMLMSILVECFKVLLEDDGRSAESFDPNNPEDLGIKPYTIN